MLDSTRRSAVTGWGDLECPAGQLTARANPLCSGAVVHVRTVNTLPEGGRPLSRTGPSGAPAARVISRRAVEPAWIPVRCCDRAAVAHAPPVCRGGRTATGYGLSEPARCPSARAGCSPVGAYRRGLAGLCSSLPVALRCVSGSERRRATQRCRPRVGAMASPPTTAAGSASRAALYDLPDPASIDDWAALMRPATGRLELVKVSRLTGRLSVRPVTVWVHCGVHYQPCRGSAEPCEAPKPGELPSTAEHSRHFGHVPLRRTGANGKDTFTVDVFRTDSSIVLSSLRDRWVVEIKEAVTENVLLRLCATSEEVAERWRKELRMRAAPLVVLMALPATTAGAAGADLVPVARSSRLEARRECLAKTLAEVAVQLFDSSMTATATAVAGVVTAEETYDLATSAGPLAGAALGALVFGFRVAVAVSAAAQDTADAATDLNEFRSTLTDHLLPVLRDLGRNPDDAVMGMINQLGELVGDMEMMAGEFHHALRSVRRRWFVALRATCHGMGVGDGMSVQLQALRTRSKETLCQVQVKLQSETFAVAKQTQKTVQVLAAAPVEAARKDLPSLPEGVYVDWTDDSSPAVRLLKAVMDRSQPSGFCTALCALGMGGVGKTVSSLLVARQVRETDEGRRRFSDGVHWVQLSQKSCEIDVVKRMCDLATNLKGSVVGAPDIDMAGRHLQGELANRKCLVIVDDVWEYRWAAHFSAAFEGQTTSSLVVSTRDRRVVSMLADDHVVEVRTLSEPVAKEVLTRAMRHAPDRAAISERHLQQAVSLCSGHALALSVMGALFHKLGGEESLRLVRSRAALLQQSLPTSEHARTYASLRACLSASHEVLKRHDDEGEVCRRHFRALCVLRTKELLPWRALAALWDVDTFEAVTEIAGQLRELSLVQLEGEQSDKEAFRLGLHDLVVEFVRGLVRMRPEERDGFPCRLLDGYCSHNKVNETMEPGPLGDAGATFRPLWKLPQDGYIEHAVCHLLHAGGAQQQRELLVMLHDMRFIAWRVKLGEGACGVYRADIRGRGVAVLDRVATVVEGAMVDQALPMEMRLKQAAFEVAERCNSMLTGGGGSFEQNLLAHLCRTARAYLGKPAVELFGRSRLVMPAELRVFPGSRPYPCICPLTSATGDRLLVAAVNGNNLEVRTVDDGSRVALLKGHTDNVSCLAVVDGGGDGIEPRVVSGSEDGTVRVWDVEKQCIVHSLKGDSAWLAMSSWPRDASGDGASSGLLGGAVALVAGDGTCTLVNTRSGKSHHLVCPRDVLNVCCFIGGRMAFGTRSGGVFCGRVDWDGAV